MNMRGLLLLSASSLLLLLLLCSAGSSLQAQTPAAPPATVAPPATAAPPATMAQPSQVAPRSDALPSIAIVVDEQNFLGILPGDVTPENMGRYGVREPRGVAVTKVIESSPAARAGIREGDVILRFDNEPVTNVRKLNRLINESAPEQVVRLTVSRQGSEQELSVKLARRKDFPASTGMLQGAMPSAEAFGRMAPLAPGTGDFALAFGMTRRIGVGATGLTKQLADYFGVAGGRGLLVTNVNEESPAAKAGLKAGDVITEVDGQPVGTPGELARAINRQSAGEVTLRIIRDKARRTIKLTPERGQASSFTGPEDFVMPQIGKLDLSRMTLPSIPKMNFDLPRMNFPQLRNFRLAPLTLPNIKLLTPKLAPMPRVIMLPPMTM